MVQVGTRSSFAYAFPASASRSRSFAPSASAVVLSTGMEASLALGKMTMWPSACRNLRWLTLRAPRRRKC